MRPSESHSDSSSRIVSLLVQTNYLHFWIQTKVNDLRSKVLSGPRVQSKHNVGIILSAYFGQSLLQFFPTWKFQGF